MKPMILLIVLVGTVVCAQAQVATNVPDEKTLSQLTNGMTEVQIQTSLGIPGRPRENTPFGQQILEYDFDGLSIWVELTLTAKDKATYATAIRERRDGLSVAQRQQARGKAWSEWVKAHQTATNHIPNKALEDTVRQLADPQRRRSANKNEAKGCCQSAHIVICLHHEAVRLERWEECLASAGAWHHV